METNNINQSSEIDSVPRRPIEDKSLALLCTRIISLVKKTKKQRTLTRKFNHTNLRELYSKSTYVSLSPRQSHFQNLGAPPQPEPLDDKQLYVDLKFVPRNIPKSEIHRALKTRGINYGTVTRMDNNIRVEVFTPVDKDILEKEPLNIRRFSDYGDLDDPPLLRKSIST